MREPPQETQPGLRRVIRFPHALSLVAGSIIGAAIFVQPSEITAQVGSVRGVLLVWLASGVLSCFGALVFAELASRFVGTGGPYLYLRKTFPPMVGFLWGWLIFWVVHTGIIAAVALIFARYTAYLMPSGGLPVKAVAVAAILMISGVNFLGVKQGNRLQTLFTALKLLAMALIVVIGFLKGAELPRHFVQSGAAAGAVTPGILLKALIAGLFAFGGWQMVTFSGGETVNPTRTIPRALIWGIATVTLVYIAMNAVYMYVLPFESVASSTRVAADAAEALFGYGGGVFVAGLVAFSTFGALSGIIMVGPRVYYSMARDGLFFDWAGRVHPRYRTPYAAIALQAGWAVVLVLTGSYRGLFTRVIYTQWGFFALLGVGLLLIKRRERKKQLSQEGFRVFSPIIVIFVFTTAAIIVNQVISDPRESLLGFLVIALGIPVYVFRFRRLKRRPTQ